jgi:hypothetical protein
MVGEPRGVELVLRDGEALASADDFPPPVELVECEEHAGIGQAGKCPLEALRLDHLLQIAVFAPGRSQEPEVGARALAVDGSVRHGEEPRLACRQPLLHDLHRLVDPNRSPEELRQIAGHPEELCGVHRHTLRQIHPSHG